MFLLFSRLPFELFYQEKKFKSEEKASAEFTVYEFFEDRSILQSSAFHLLYAAWGGADPLSPMGKPQVGVPKRAGKYFEHCVYPVFGDQGQVARLAAFARDVTVQKQAQKELEAKSRDLEEMNTALKVLLNQREVDRKDPEDKVLSNVKKLMLTVLHRLRDCGLNEEARAFLDVLETNVNEVISPFLGRLDAYRFTPRELEIISLVREGRTAKEIARLLNVCKGAVDACRHRVRKKLGVTTKTNLRSHLLSLSPQ